MPEGNPENCQCSHSWGGVEGSANNSVFCKHAQWVTGDLRDCTSWWTVPEEEYSVPPFPAGLLQFCYFTQLYRTGFGGFYYINWWAELAPNKAVTATEAKRRPCPTSSASSGHHITNNTPSQGKNSQHILRKDVVGIRTKTAFPTKIDSCSLHSNIST